jgi:hypothetical protein
VIRRISTFLRERLSVGDAELTVGDHALAGLRPVTIEVVPSEPSSRTLDGLGDDVDEFVVGDHDARVRVVEKRGRRDADAGHGGQRSTAVTGSPPAACRRVRDEHLDGEVGRTRRHLAEHRDDACRCTREPAPATLSVDRRADRNRERVGSTR